MIVRLGSPDDAATLAALAARTFEETFAQHNDPADMAAYLAKHYGEMQQRRELEDENIITIIVEEDSVMMAFAQLHPAPVADIENAIEIARFYVDRPWHGRGIAQTLMREVKRIARERGFAALWLGVWERNLRAIAFYEKTGFRDIGSQPFLLGRDLQTDRVMIARSLQETPARKEAHGTNQ